MTNNKLTEEQLSEIISGLERHHRYYAVQPGGAEKNAANVMYMALQAIQELQERRKADEWIKCCERMPNIEKEVLALWSGGIYTLHTRMVFGNLTWDDGDFNSGIPLNEVTHWMPLPAPPEQQ